jgi:DNA polymerase III delta prime subunit
MNKNEIWVEKYRPKNLEDIIMSDQNRTYFSSINDILNNYLFLGSPGTGKNTLAFYLQEKFAPNTTLYINASSESGIDIVRNKITDFISTTSFDGRNKLVILSEFDGFSLSAQQALREIMEQYLDSVRFILTANFSNKIIEAIKSRCEEFGFKPDKKGVSKRIVHILKNENIEGWKDNADDIKILINRHFPDIRKITNELQKCCITGKFVAPSSSNLEFPQTVWKMLKNKTNVFDIRKHVIENDVAYDNDFHSLMRNLFDLASIDGNVGACLTIADHMYKHQMVMDVEVNFSSLILTLSKL